LNLTGKTTCSGLSEVDMSGILSKGEPPWADVIANGVRRPCTPGGVQRRRYDELTPLGVERCGRLGGNRLIERAALLPELRDVVADRDKHVAIGRKFRLVADRIAVAGDDDRLVSHGGNVCISGLDHPVAGSARLIVRSMITAPPP